MKIDTDAQTIKSNRKQRGHDRSFDRVRSGQKSKNNDIRKEIFSNPKGRE